jgi:hypothetical protein
MPLGCVVVNIHLTHFGAEFVLKILENKLLTKCLDLSDVE